MLLGCGENGMLFIQYIIDNFDKSPQIIFTKFAIHQDEPRLFFMNEPNKKKGFCWYWENRFIPTFWIVAFGWGLSEYTGSNLFGFLGLLGLGFVWGRRDAWKTRLSKPVMNRLIEQSPQVANYRILPNIQNISPQIIYQQFLRHYYVCHNRGFPPMGASVVSKD